MTNINPNLLTEGKPYIVNLKSGVVKIGFYSRHFICDFREKLWFRKTINQEPLNDTFMEKLEDIENCIELGEKGVIK